MKSISSFSFSSDIIERANLSDYTTFHLGGPCRGLIDCATPQELIGAVKQLAKDEREFILIGGGSNLVVSDAGLDCYVIRYLSRGTACRAPTSLIEQQGETLNVAASVLLDDLAQYAIEQGLEGINFCSGIPGTVGGAVVGNAGAFGKQIGDVLAQVTLLTRTGEIKQVGPDDLGFSYRHSNLKERDEMVVDVTLTLRSVGAYCNTPLQKERDEILATRHEKHPDLAIEPCAGSFFRNIEPTSQAGKRQATGWFLEQAGGKDLRSGGAYIFPKHANIIVKGDQATAKDVYELSQKMAALAKEKYKLDLVREVRFVGRIPGMPKDVKTIIW